MVFFFILKLFFHLMSFHPALPSYPVFHRGLNHLPFPLTQLFIVSPDVCTSPLCSTDTLHSRVFPTSASFIPYLFLSLERYIRSEYFLLSFKQESQPPNWRHPSFSWDPRKGTLLTAERGWSGSSTFCYRPTICSAMRRLCAMRRGWEKKAEYWQLQQLEDGCSSHRSRKDHFCYFSSLYTTTYFYPVGLTSLGYITGQG